MTALAADGEYWEDPARRYGPPTPGCNDTSAVCRALDLTFARVPGVTLAAEVRLIAFEKAKR